MASPRGQWRTGNNGENWLQDHLWCLNDPRCYGFDDDDDDDGRGGGIGVDVGSSCGGFHGNGGSAGCV